MARRRRRDETAVSLFPFLSVLACVIGTLTLLLSALAVGHMGGESVEQVFLAERLRASEISLAGGTAILEELEAQLALQSQALQDEEEVGRRLAGLGLELDISLEDLEQWVHLQSQLAEMDDRQGVLEDQIKALKRRTKDKQADLKKRESIQKGAPIIIDPSGMGRDQRPYFVLCTADYVEILNRGGESYGRFPTDQLEFDKLFEKFLVRAGRISDAIVIFLIRPEGVATHSLASRAADQLGVRNAKLPLPGTGEIDFSRLREGNP